MVFLIQQMALSIIDPCKVGIYASAIAKLEIWVINYADSHLS